MTTHPQFTRPVDAEAAPLHAARTSNTDIAVDSARPAGIAAHTSPTGHTAAIGQLAEVRQQRGTPTHDGAMILQRAAQPTRPGTRRAARPTEAPLTRISAGTRVSSADPVVDALRTEWQGWRDQPLPDAWRCACPELAQVPSFRQALEVACLDDVAAFLVIACQGGGRRAGRLLVQALLPRLAAQASRDRRHEVGDYVSTLWELLHDFPIERRTHAVATNLVLDTRKRLHRAAGREVPCSQPPEPPTPPASSSRERAAVIIDLAARRGLITAPSAEVLRSVYLYGLSGREAAGRHEMSEDMVRYRCSSSVKRLRRHMSDLAG